MFPTVPLSLYIHTPWCIKKCPYCDFNSHQLPIENSEDAYFAALLQDFLYNHPKLKERKFNTAFVGGGTPSLMSAKSYEKLLHNIFQASGNYSEIEITLEANPGTVDQHRFLEYQSIGINRLSIGVQSFQDDKLSALGRIHGKDEAVKAIKAAIHSKFSTFNVDLMFGLPNQSIAEAIHDLQTAISLDAPHISWYQLTLEPNTLFYKHPPILPSDEKIWEMQQRGQALLKENGYEQYEVSAYARSGHQCKHNRNYWEFGDYLGIGAGAHSKITNTENNKILRTAKMKQPKAYLSAAKKVNIKQVNPYIQEKKVVSLDELPGEFMLNALRLCQPIPIQLFQERTGLNITVIKDQIDIAEQKKLLYLNNQFICLTDMGKQFLNDVVALFI